MAQNDFAPRVESVRRFNRFYTKQIGVLSEHVLKTQFSLAEARVIYELAQREKATATEMGAELGLDAGYLSRLLEAFKKKGLISRKPSETDGRQSVIWLTEKGRKAFAELNAHSHNEIEALLGRLSPADRDRLIDAMRVIEELLGAQPEQKVPYIIRPHRPGDMGWVTHRHGVIYNEEYGWDEEFEALVAEIAAKFIRNYDPKRERCWIAERGGGGSPRNELQDDKGGNRRAARAADAQSPRTVERDERRDAARTGRSRAVVRRAARSARRHRGRRGTGLLRGRRSQRIPDCGGGPRFGQILALSPRSGPIRTAHGRRHRTDARDDYCSIARAHRRRGRRAGHGLRPARRG